MLCRFISLYLDSIYWILLPSRHHQLCHAPHTAHGDHCRDCGASHPPPKSERVQSLRHWFNGNSRIREYLPYIRHMQDLGPYMALTYLHFGILNGKNPPFLLGKFTIAVAMFNSYEANYQRVCHAETRNLQDGANICWFAKFVHMTIS